MGEILEAERRHAHVYRLSSIVVWGHGIAVTSDWACAAALLRAELERAR